MLWERKLDGVRAMVSYRWILMRGSVIRNDGIYVPKGYLLDGEIMNAELSGRFTDIYPRLMKGAWTALQFYPFDCLYHPDAGDVRRLPLTTRLELLVETGQYDSSVMVWHMPQWEFKGVPPQDWEGLIGKNLTSPYTSGRNPSWRKWKHPRAAIVKAVGFSMGKGKNRGSLGAIKVAVWLEKQDRWHPCGEVGTGFTDYQRRIIWTNQSEFLGRMMHVSYMEATPTGVLRNAAFKGWVE